MTPEQDRWGFASKLLERHGMNVGEYIKGKIQPLPEGDPAVDFWVDIADKVCALHRPRPGAPLQ